jgi:hypothetical protein
VGTVRGVHPCHARRLEAVRAVGGDLEPYAWDIGAGLSVIHAAAAWHHFQALDFLAHSFVEDSVGQEDQPVRAGAGVVVLTGFAWTEYARLFDVHSSVPTFLWAGLRGVSAPAGPSLYPTHIFYLYITHLQPFYGTLSGRDHEG